MPIEQYRRCTDKIRKDMRIDREMVFLGKQYVLRSLKCCALTVLAVLLAWVLYDHFVASKLIGNGIPVLWKNQFYSTDCGRSYTIFTLPSKVGPEYRVAPKLVFGQDNIIYWSSQDRAVGVITASNHLRWLPLPLAANDTVSQLYLTAEDVVFVNTYGDYTAKVFRMNTITGHTDTVVDACEARANHVSANYMVLTTKGEFVLHTPETSSVILQVPTVAGLSWDYDPQQACLIYGYGRMITIVHLPTRKRQRIVIPEVWRYTDIICQPREKRFWVVQPREIPVLSYREIVRVYDYAGALCGQRFSFSGPPLNGPMVNLTVAQMQLLRSIIEKNHLITYKFPLISQNIYR